MMQFLGSAPSVHLVEETELNGSEMHFSLHRADSSDC